MLVLDDLILWAGFILTCIHHWRNDRIFIVPTTTSKDHQNVCWNRYRCITTWSASIRAQESLQLWNCSYFLDWVWSHRPSAVAETVSGQWFDFCIFLPCWLYNIFSKTNKYSAHPTQDEMRRLEAKFKGTEECQALGGRSCICEHHLATLKYDFFLYLIFFSQSVCCVYLRYPTFKLAPKIYCTPNESLKKNKGTLTCSRIGDLWYSGTLHSIIPKKTNKRNTNISDTGLTQKVNRRRDVLQVELLGLGVGLGENPKSRWI